MGWETKEWKRVERDRGVDEEWDPREAKADDPVGLLKEAMPIDDTKQLLLLLNTISNQTDTNHSSIAPVLLPRRMPLHCFYFTPF
jgi:hypothetical protein